MDRARGNTWKTNHQLIHSRWSPRARFKNPVVGIFLPLIDRRDDLHLHKPLKITRLSLFLLFSRFFFFFLNRIVFTTSKLVSCPFGFGLHQVQAAHEKWPCHAACLVRFILTSLARGEVSRIDSLQMDRWSDYEQLSPWVIGVRFLR